GSNYSGGRVLVGPGRRSRRREEADFSPKSHVCPPPHVGGYHFSDTLLQTPSGAVLAAEEIVGLVEICELQVGGIPEQPVPGKFLAELDPQGDVSQEHRLGQRSGPVKI